MSMLLMVKAMNTKVGNPIRKLVLLKLADNANDQGECWPSYSYIADQCECSKSAVKSHIADLIESGLLVKENRCGVEKGNKSNIYILKLDNPVSPESMVVGHQKAQGGSPKSTGWVTKKHPPVPSESTRTYHIEPVNEPVIEPIICDKPQKQKKSQQLPSDFTIKESHQVLAKKLGIHLNSEFEHFRDHHLAKGSTMKSWDAALNLWLRNAAKFAKTKQTYKTRSERNMELLKKSTEFKSPFDFDDDVIEHARTNE